MLKTATNARPKCHNARKGTTTINMIKAHKLNLIIGGTNHNIHKQTANAAIISGKQNKIFIILMK